MDILGHSSYQLTMNTYSHVAPELSSEAARLTAGAVWNSPSPEADAAVRRGFALNVGCQPTPGGAPQGGRWRRNRRSEALC
jgi:hypothetical protein